VRESVTIVAGDLNRYIQQPYADEIRCLAKALNISLGDIVLLNAGYELSLQDLDL